MISSIQHSTLITSCISDYKFRWQVISLTINSETNYIYDYELWWPTFSLTMKALMTTCFPDYKLWRPAVFQAIYNSGDQLYPWPYTVMARDIPLIINSDEQLYLWIWTLLTSRNPYKLRITCTTEYINTGKAESQTTNSDDQLYPCLWTTYEDQLYPCTPDHQPWWPAVSLLKNSRSSAVSLIID